MFLGFSYKPLSTLSFAEPGRVPLSVPMTSELKRQHGSDILCWPYTLSPLSLPQVAKSLSNSHITTGDGANWDPASLNFKMVSASVPGTHMMISEKITLSAMRIPDSPSYIRR